ncbi:MAG: tRNA (N6-isopentenyl adenosine(37)-C2)-methylthiotransferase MiaB, partial [Lutibacter sp.]
MGNEKIIVEKNQGQPLLTEQIEGNSKKLYIETYGCSMNLNDSEIVASILSKQGYNT